MFVASSLARGAYKYATGGSNSGQQNPEATPTTTRVKRRPKRPTAGPSPPPGGTAAGASSSNTNTSPPPSYDEVQAQQGRSAADKAKLAVIDSIIAEQDLYKVLGIKRNAKTDEIRRAFLNRSRVCHPDKFPNYPASTIAFQKVSFAYETLSKPSSRRIYDVSGRTDFAAAMNSPAASGSFASATGYQGAGAPGSTSEETLNGVLYSVFCEFMEGDFEMIRVLVNALNEGNQGMHLGSDAVDSLEGAFRRLRKVLLAGKKYLTIIRFELIRLYEIQHSLRQLSYFDVFGRLRLTLQLARVTLSIPMAIDQAMKEPSDDSEDDDYEGEPADEEDGNGEAGASRPRRHKKSPKGANDEWSQSESDLSDSESDHDGPSIAYTRPPTSKQTNDFGIVPSSDPEDQLDNAEAREAEARRIRRQARVRAKTERDRRRRARRAKVEDGTVSASASADAGFDGSKSQRNSRVFEEKDGEDAGLKAFPTSGSRTPSSGNRTPMPASPVIGSDGPPSSSRETHAANAQSEETSPLSEQDGAKAAGSRYTTPLSTPLKNVRLSPNPGRSHDDTSAAASPSPSLAAGNSNPPSASKTGLRPPFTHRRSRTTSTPTGFAPAENNNDHHGQNPATPSPNRRTTLHPDDPIIRAHTYGRVHGRTMSNAVPPSSSAFNSPSGSSTFSSASFRRHREFGVDEEEEEELMDEDGGSRRQSRGSSSGHGSRPPGSSSSATSSPSLSTPSSFTSGFYDPSSTRSAANAAAAAARTREREREREKKGLLGPTAAGLLKGVVKVLETSEAWVPGAAAAAKREAEED
ncbi:hypothetical protein V8E36_002730 [Tilletia maclaganii]